jgi:ssDNA-binding Zn-finger/Zn-ribbon topoisomerase 1
MILKEKQFTETQSIQQAAGDRQEKSVAFYLRRSFKNHESVFVFHDLNITYGGEFAQIDHLVVYKYGFILIESKSITGEVRVNSEGEWSRSYQGKWSGIPSPVKQVDLQLALLHELLAANVEKLLGKLFNKLQTKFGGRKWDALCAISSNAIIDRSQVTDAINGRMVKSEFVSDKVTEIMNLPSKLKAKAGFLLDDRAGFLDEELDRICKFLLSVDKKTLELKAQSNAPVQKSAPVVLETKPVLATPMVVKQAVNQLLSCKKCGKQSNLTGKWGKFGYYVQCSACETNTSLKVPCPSCKSSDVKNRKEKTKFFLLCAACNTETLIHENKPS